MSDFKKKVRIAQLKAMHTLMCNANDEDIYITWITLGVPDEPMESDFESIAEDDDDYNEVFDLFVRLIADKGCRY